MTSFFSVICILNESVSALPVIVKKMPERFTIREKYSIIRNYIRQIKEEMGVIMELSFGEQIMILLKRKNMTIQDLAAMYEMQTGNKMSRQNLSQRLKRDNFPEQDMHIIAALMGYKVSIQLTPVTVSLPEYVRLDSAASSIHPMFPAKPEIPTRSRTPEAIPILEAMKASSEEAAPKEAPEEKAPVIKDLSDEVPVLEDIPIQEYKAETAEQPSGHEKSPADDGGIKFQIPDAFRKNHARGDVNPLTGEEYLTNTVRRHPEIPEFLQVYDRTTHEWSDVREDYFWEFQEKKKKMLGKEYKAPIMI